MATILYLTQIQFEFGAIRQLAAECERIGIRRPLVVTDAGVRDAKEAAEAAAHRIAEATRGAAQRLKEVGQDAIDSVRQRDPARRRPRPGPCLRRRSGAHRPGGREGTGRNPDDAFREGIEGKQGKLKQQNKM